MCYRQTAFHEEKMTENQQFHLEQWKCTRFTIAKNTKAGKRIFNIRGIIWILLQSQWGCPERKQYLLRSKQHFWKINLMLIYWRLEEKIRTKLGRPIKWLCWYFRNSWLFRLQCEQHNDRVYRKDMQMKTSLSLARDWMERIKEGIKRNFWSWINTYVEKEKQRSRSQFGERRAVYY